MNIQLRINKKFSVKEYSFESIPETIKFLETSPEVKESYYRIYLDNRQIDLTELKASQPVTVTSYYDNSLNTHVFDTVAEAIDFFEEEPLGRITSGVIKQNGSSLSRQELYELGGKKLKL